MAATKRKTTPKPKRESISREELAQKKSALGEKLEKLHEQVMSFCRGAPPKRVVNGSYQMALDYKDLISKTRGLILNKSGSPAQLEQRINRFTEKLKQFQKFV